MIKAFRIHNKFPTIDFKYGASIYKKIGCEFLMYNSVKIPRYYSKTIAYCINPYYTHILTYT